MEDLDPPREVPGAADDILRTLEALGLRWDGAVLRQSERGDAYRAALDRAASAGARSTPARCTRREIADSALAGHRRRASSIPGTCRNGLPPGRAARATRVRVDDAVIEFDDALQGEMRQRSRHATSAISCCCAPTGCSPTSSPSSSTTRRRASPTSCAARTCSTPRRARSFCSGCSVCRRRATSTCRSRPTPPGRSSRSRPARRALDRSQPGAALVAALRFLGQPRRRELERATGAHGARVGGGELGPRAHSARRARVRDRALLPLAFRAGTRRSAASTCGAPEMSL